MRPFPRQFSLRSLAWSSVMLGVLLSLWITASRRQQAVAQKVSEFDGRVTYAKPPLFIPRSAISTLGNDYFCRIDNITLYPSADVDADEQVRILKDLPELRSLSIWPGCKGLKIAPSNPPGGLSDQGVDFLLSHLPNLKHLSLLSAQISENAERKLLNQTAIESLQYETHSTYGNRHGGRQ